MTQHSAEGTISIRMSELEKKVSPLSSLERMQDVAEAAKTLSQMKSILRANRGDPALLKPYEDAYRESYLDYTDPFRTKTYA